MTSNYPTTLPKYLTRQQVADMFETNDRTVDRWIATGALEAVKVGPRFVRIPMEAVEALVARGRS